jgi:hypothetical protein
MSRRMLIAFEISAKRITDDGVEVDAPALGVEHGAAVQVASGAHVEAALQGHIGLAALGLAELKIIVDGLLERHLDALGVLSFIGHQVAGPNGSSVRRFRLRPGKAVEYGSCWIANNAGGRSPRGRPSGSGIFDLVIDFSALFGCGGKI